MIAILAVGGLCLVVLSSWLTVAHWIRAHADKPAHRPPTLVVIEGGRDFRY